MIKIFSVFSLFSTLLFAHKVTSTLVSNLQNPVPNDNIVISLNLDMTQMKEPDSLLGSCTFEITWDSSVLAYQEDSGLMNSFAGAINRDSIKTGKLRIAAANPLGPGGKFTLMQIGFEVIGENGISTEVRSEFEVLAATISFKNLLPNLEVHNVNIDIGVVNNIPQEKSQLKSFQLYPNYPNPFNHTTKIQYAISQYGKVRLEIFHTMISHCLGQ